MPQYTLKQLEQMDPAAAQEAIRSMSDADLEALAAPPPDPTEIIRNLPDDKLDELTKLSPAEQERALGIAGPKESVGILGAIGGAMKAGAALTPAGLGQMLFRPEVRQDAAEGLLGASRAVESVTAAPVRAGVRELQESGDFGAAIGAAGGQFGMAPEQAPTGKDIAAKAGISTEPAFSLPVIGDVSPAGAAGLVAEMVLDPTALISFGGGTASKAAGKTLLKAVPLKENADEIIKAATKLNTKVTPGQIYDSQLVGKLQAALQQQRGKIGGINLRSTVDDNFKKLRQEASDLVGDVTSRDRAEIGKEAKEAIEAAVAAKIKPSEDVYDMLVSQYGKQGADTDAIFDALDDLAETSIGSPDALAEVNKWRSQADDLQTIEHIQNYIKNLGRAGRSDNLEKSFVARSLARAAKKARSSSLRDVGKEVNADLLMAAADKNYAEAAKMVNDVLPRGKSVKEGVRNTLEKYLETQKSDGIVETLLNTRDPEKMAALQRSFPEAFESMRQGKIANIVAKATPGEELNPRRLAKAIDEMPNQSAELLLGPGAKEKSKALVTFINSMPDKINPSGTAEMDQLVGMFNVLRQLGSVTQSAALEVLTSGGRLQTAGSALQSFALPAQAAQQFGRELNREPTFGIPQE